MKKMFCVDIDGTLLRSDGTISNETKKLFVRLKEKGHEIVLCTARSRESAINIWKSIQCSNYIITSSGSEIYNCLTKEVIYINEVDNNTCKELYEICSNNDLKISFAVDDKEYVNSSFWNNQIDIFSYNEIKDKSVKSIMVVCNDYNKSFDLFERIPNLYKVKSCCQKPEKSDIGYWFNVLDRDTSKGSAILILSKLLHIRKNNIISFGNDYNDVSMFEVSGIKCAVSNSEDCLKSKADMIIKSNDENGVFEYMYNNHFD